MSVDKTHNMKKYDMSKSVFYERYKPQCLDDVILPGGLKSKLKRHIKDETLPNLGFFSVLPGSGKSSCCNAILKDIGGEALWINASLENGIDVVRGKILKFAQQNSFDDKMKVVVMDECLEENEHVRIGTVDEWVSTALNELTHGVIYNCVSFNMKTGKLENDTCEIQSDKIDEIYEVVLPDGSKVKVTGNHPFIVKENDKYIEKSIFDGLNEHDEIVTVRTI